jgi:predicted PurR-regulated permease PerM
MSRKENKSFLTILMVLAVAMVTAVFLPLWHPFLVAAVVAGATFGAQSWLTALLRGHRYLAAAVLSLVVSVLILLPLSVLVVVGIQQLLATVGWVRRTLREGGFEQMIVGLPESIQPMARRAVRAIPENAGELLGTLTRNGDLAGDVAAGLSTVSSIVLSFALMVIALFFFLADGKKLIGWLSTYAPLSRAERTEFLDDMRSISRTLLGANLGTGIAQSLVATIGYLIVNLPQPALFALLTFVTSFVPSVGTSIVLLPVSAVLLITGKTWQGIFLAAWGIALVTNVDNLLRPYLTRGRLRLHGAAVFFSFVGGVTAFGPIGLLAGPMALAFFVSCVRVWRRSGSRRDEVAVARRFEGRGGVPQRA